MATKFNVIYLGQFAEIDPTEGNNLAENAGLLVGQTIGGSGDALSARIQVLQPGSVNFSGGLQDDAYDLNNEDANETFRIDGGPDQVFDSSVVYNATVTYLDGSTATVSAVVLQDTAGNTYLAPEFSSNTDQDAYDAGPIESLTIDSLLSDEATGLFGDREVGFVPCFTSGTLILTPSGTRKVETLVPGDLVTTRDNGSQPIRWLGSANHICEGELVPIRISKGALGIGLPSRDLIVSPQHRILIRSRIAERMFETSEVLVPAKKLVGIPMIDFATDIKAVTYLHILLDSHEIVFAEGAETESLLLGPQARRALGPSYEREIRQIFPDADFELLRPARLVPTGRRAKHLIQRHQKNAQPFVQV